MKRIFIILISFLLLSSCTSISKNQDEGESMNSKEETKSAEDKNELIMQEIYPIKNITLMDVIAVEDWDNYHNILGRCHELSGLDTNIITEIYNLSDGGVLKVKISYPENGKIYPYLVYGNTLVVFFDNKNYSEFYMNDEGCVRCIYISDITNNLAER